MARRRGERSEKAEYEDHKILKKRLRMLERENQRLRKELRKLEVIGPVNQEVQEFEAPKDKEVGKQCSCVTITMRNGIKKTLTCGDCKARKAT